MQRCVRGGAHVGIAPRGTASRRRYVRSCSVQRAARIEQRAARIEHRAARVEYRHENACAQACACVCDVHVAGACVCALVQIAAYSCTPDARALRENAHEHMHKCLMRIRGHMRISG